MLPWFYWMAYGVFNCKNIQNCLKPWRDLLRCWRCSSHWNISRSQILATRSQSQSKSCNDKCSACIDAPIYFDTVAFQHYFLFSVTGQPGQGLASSKGRQGHQWPNHLMFNKSVTMSPHPAFPVMSPCLPCVCLLLMSGHLASLSCSLPHHLLELRDMKRGQR